MEPTRPAFDRSWRHRSLQVLGGFFCVCSIIECIDTFLSPCYTAIFSFRITLSYHFSLFSPPVFCAIRKPLTIKRLIYCFYRVQHNDPFYLVNNSVFTLTEFGRKIPFFFFFSYFFVASPSSGKWTAWHWVFFCAISLCATRREKSIYLQIKKRARAKKLNNWNWFGSCNE